MRPKAIVIHCSASTWGTREDIDAWHRARGFNKYDVKTNRTYGIGYHAVVLNGRRDSRMRYQESLDGHISLGRPDHLVGAHCAADRMNGKALGVCLIGNPGWGGYPTERQIDALVHYLRVKCAQYGIPVNKITQHSDHEPGKPLCASLDIADIRRRVQEA